MIEKEWVNYKEKIYAGLVIGATQEKETKQAFMAGAFVAYNILINAMDSGMDESKLNVLFQGLYSELNKNLKPI